MRTQAIMGAAAMRTSLSVIADQHFREKRFIDLAYSEPLYIKDFNAVQRKTLI